MRSKTFDAIGTRWTIDVYDEPADTRYESALAEVEKRISEYDKTFSRFRDDSLIARMAHHHGAYPLDDTGVTLISLYEKLYYLTDGAFTPLIGSLLESAGYDKKYSLSPQTLLPPQRWENILTLQRATLTLHEPAVLDFGAAGKGQLIDIVATTLLHHDITSYCIDAGGDIRHQNSDKKLKVGLEHPDDARKVIGVTEIGNESIAASSGNRRKWGEYHHIMNPKTLRPVNDILATWVIARNAIIADGLATALFLVRPGTLERDFSFSYLILNRDYSIRKSEDFPAELYYNE
jgi:FAD:protein FMN transferase